MSVRFQSWQEYRDVGPVNCGHNFVTAHRGQHVLVIVADRWREIAAVIAMLDPEIVSVEVKDE